ncbi:MAG: hypothetical protein ACXACW_00400, partial [Candidatus Hodarchaeales archaeon]
FHLRNKSCYFAFMLKKRYNILEILLELESELMSSSDDTSFQEKVTLSTPNTTLNPFIYWILFTASLITIILGLFSITGVIVETTKTNHLNYFDGLLVGLLLVAGGFVSLLGVIIMKKWSPPPIPEAGSDSL